MLQSAISEMTSRAVTNCHRANWNRDALVSSKGFLLLEGKNETLFLQIQSIGRYQYQSKGELDDIAVRLRISR